MTQPAPTTGQQQASQAQVGVLVGLLASTATTAALAAGLATLAGVSVTVARALLLRQPRLRHPATTVAGPAARWVMGMEPTYRAAYLLAAARRVQAAVDGGATVDDAVTAEMRFARLHVAAQVNRVRAALLVDRQAARSRSLVLGWRAVLDARTSPECRAASGKNFDVARPPLIGFPGSVHPHCRCRPVPAFVGAGWVDGVTANVGEARKAAVG